MRLFQKSSTTNLPQTQTQHQKQREHENIMLNYEQQSLQQGRNDVHTKLRDIHNVFESLPSTEDEIDINEALKVAETIRKLADSLAGLALKGGNNEDVNEAISSGSKSNNSQTRQNTAKQQQQQQHLKRNNYEKQQAEESMLKNSLNNESPISPSLAHAQKGEVARLVKVMESKKWQKPDAERNANTLPENSSPAGVVSALVQRFSKPAALSDTFDHDASCQMSTPPPMTSSSNCNVAHPKIKLDATRSNCEKAIHLEGESQSLVEVISTSTQSGPLSSIKNLSRQRSGSVSRSISHSHSNISRSKSVPRSIKPSSTTHEVTHRSHLPGNHKRNTRTYDPYQNEIDFTKSRDNSSFTSRTRNNSAQASENRQKSSVTDMDTSKLRMNTLNLNSLASEKSEKSARRRKSSSSEDSAYCASRSASWTDQSLKPRAPVAEIVAVQKSKKHEPSTYNPQAERDYRNPHYAFDYQPGSPVLSSNPVKSADSTVSTLSTRSVRAARIRKKIWKIICGKVNEPKRLSSTTTNTTTTENTMHKRFQSATEENNEEDNSKTHYQTSDHLSNRDSKYFNSKNNIISRRGTFDDAFGRKNDISSSHSPSAFKVVCPRTDFSQATEKFNDHYSRLGYAAEGNGLRRTKSNISINRIYGSNLTGQSPASYGLRRTLSNLHTSKSYEAPTIEPNGGDYSLRYTQSNVADIKKSFVGTSEVQNNENNNFVRQQISNLQATITSGNIQNVEKFKLPRAWSKLQASDSYNDETTHPTHPIVDDFKLAKSESNLHGVKTFEEVPIVMSRDDMHTETKSHTSMSNLSGSTGAFSITELVKYMSFKDNLERGFEVLLEDSESFREKFFPAEKIEKDTIEARESSSHKFCRKNDVHNIPGSQSATPTAGNLRVRSAYSAHSISSSDRTKSLLQNYIETPHGHTKEQHSPVIDRRRIPSYEQVPSKSSFDRGLPSMLRSSMDAEMVLTAQVSKSRSSISNKNPKSIGIVRE